MFINRGNHNNLLHYSNLTDSVAFKIIKYILLVTSLILLLMYVVLYVVFMLFAVKFIEQFQAESKQLQRENVVAEVKVAATVVFIGVLCLQSALIYAIYRELYRVINLFAIFSLFIALSILRAQGVFLSFGHFLIALLHSVLLFYYAYRIRKIRMANVLYIANSGQDGLMYSNYATAPTIGFNPMKAFRPKLFSSHHRNQYATQPYAYGMPFNPNSNYYPNKFDAMSQSQPYSSAYSTNMIDPATGYPVVGTSAIAPAGSLYPVQPTGQFVSGQAHHLQPHPSSTAAAAASLYNSTSQLATGYSNPLTATSASTLATPNTYSTVLNQGNAITSGYQHVTSNPTLTAMDRYSNVYGNRSVSRQTPQVPLSNAYQRSIYDSNAYSNNPNAVLGAGAQRSWNVNVNPVADYVQPGSLISNANGVLASTNFRTSEPIYMARSDAIYSNNADNYMNTNRRTNAYVR